MAPMKELQIEEQTAFFFAGKLRGSVASIQTSGTNGKVPVLMGIHRDYREGNRREMDSLLLRETGTAGK